MFHLRPKNAQFIYIFLKKRGSVTLRLPIPKKCVILRDLAWLVQLKDVKHPWRSFTFDFTKSNTLPWLFFTSLNCTNGNKTHKASQIQKKVMSQFWGNRVTATRTEKAEFIGPKKWSKSTVRPWFSIPKGTWTKCYSNIFPLYNALDVLRMYYVCLIWFECPLGFNVAFGKRTVVK